MAAAQTDSLFIFHTPFQWTKIRTYVKFSSVRGEAKKEDPGKAGYPARHLPAFPQFRIAPPPALIHYVRSPN
jgi:hypothetical protein